VGHLRVNVNIDFKSFTGPESAKRFSNRQVFDALNDISNGRVKDWAFEDLQFVSAEYLPSPGEVVRYEVQARGFEYVVVDNENTGQYIVFGPVRIRQIAEKVQELLQQIHEGEVSLASEPVEEYRGGDSGDTYDLPF
jgi:hypothetical protein